MNTEQLILYNELVRESIDEIKYFDENVLKTLVGDDIILDEIIQEWYEGVYDLKYHDLRQIEDLIILKYKHLFE